MEAVPGLSLMIDLIDIRPPRLDMDVSSLL